MTTIQPISIPLTTTKTSQTANQQIAAAGTNSFEALLSSFNTSTKTGASSGLDISNNNDQLFSFIDDLFANITDSLNGDFSQMLSQFTPKGFSFTSDFTSTFGTSGPLPVFIAQTAANLNLNTTQQTALQDIAVNNKDIVKSPETVQKIAAELQAAGIYAA